MTLAGTAEAIHTLAELVERLGGVPLERIRFHPYPGTATEEDVVRVEQEENRLCELVDGVLVEKAMGFRESILAVALARYLHEFVVPRNLGVIAGEGGMLRLFAGSVRVPDVAFVSWAHLPNGQVPDVPVPRLAPDLAVEALSRSNTSGEMQRRREEYFEAGVAVVWMVDPERRLVTAFTSSDDPRVCTANDVLPGEPVLPGFSLLLSDLFAELDRQPNRGS